MQKKKRTPIAGVWMLGLGLAAAGPVSAIGFGSLDPVATLGQTLDISVPLRMEPGEDLQPECVTAEVQIGETVLPRAAVGATLVIGSSGIRAIRVRTLPRIDEPVVTVQVTAGCGQGLTRRFVVFADPPMMVVPPAVAQAASSPGAERAAPVRAAADAPPPAAAPTAPAAAPAAPAPTRRVTRSRPRPRSDAAGPGTAVASGPRLKLEAAPPAAAAMPTPALPASAALTAETLALVDQANDAVKAAIAAASASQARIAALEAEMRRLAAEGQAQRERLEQLRAREVEAESRRQWSWMLAAGVLVLLATAGWLWLRVRELERDRRQHWLDAARPATPPATPPGPPPSPSQVPLLVERSLRTTGTGSLGAGLAPVHQPTPSELPEPATTVAGAWRAPTESAAMRTQPLVPSAPVAAAAAEQARDMSAEELIDLEQQAEFFVVLGQDEAAIDLLVSHLRESGGASPLPYLKLLDIYRRRGDRESYERTRDRFNHRFNAHVPDWDAAPAEGRALEDYPAVMHWLQKVWPRPLDAMAELESLLFRKDGGELFDLPAYRELLLLYALARELLDGDTGGAGNSVDVLLPLNDVPPFQHTSPRPYFGDDVPPSDIRPTAPIDLDLGSPDDREPRS